MGLMTFARHLVSLFITGLILWVVMVAGLFVAGFIVAFLPFGLLGGFSDYVALFVLIVLFGIVGKWGIRYIP